MNISEALCAAADHIERYPERYNFMCGAVPRNGGEHACMLGRVGQVAGVPAGISVDVVCQAVLGQGAQAFYADIHAAAQLASIDESVHNARAVPVAMRQISKRYEGIPEDVRDIFRERAPAFSDYSRIFALEMNAMASAFRRPAPCIALR